ncbi:MAG: twin-arginine translocase TatA/TatE family subunit [Planctomycetota bacterium]|nr:MAG: twin-arginine translocase TatA/TatE family subunit [Planctomycetota bacterium]
MLAFFRSIGPFELVVILVIVLLLFGRRVPEIAKALGKGVREFKKGISGIGEEIEKAGEEESAKSEEKESGEKKEKAKEKEA